MKTFVEVVLKILLGKEWDVKERTEKFVRFPGFPEYYGRKLIMVVAGKGRFRFFLLTARTS